MYLYCCDKYQGEVHQIWETTIIVLCGSVEKINSLHPCGVAIDIDKRVLQCMHY